MDFMTLAKNRFSVRNYEEKQIEKEKMDKILKAAHIAPTAKNWQSARIYVVQSEAGISKLRSLTGCAYNAPTVMLIGYEESEQYFNEMEEGISSGQQDASIVATHMMLEAADLGIGSVWVDVFPNTKTAQAFNLPESVKLVCLMPMGYAAEGTKPAPMHETYRPMDEMIKMM
ncbi:nitroreductase family protein [Eubacterium oxidoreducens]|uniref:Nitroreductase n=1 Tax=Eubacterium oxidoreducens TaxID=1732 RepID=A0A1G6AZ54_EUBOX|nr:nitroreductase family protein [Eubacterium oxidoreducens]SDB13660.1 Nitroreductase [Eubacterium oxidoreducens]